MFFLVSSVLRLIMFSYLDPVGEVVRLLEYLDLVEEEQRTCTSEATEH